MRPDTRERVTCDNRCKVTAPARKRLGLALSLACQAAAAGVTNCADDGVGSLRYAVLTANSGDTIDLTGLSCSVIALTSGAIYVGLDDLTINGPGMSKLVIDGGKIDRVLQHGGAGTLTVANVSVANGKVAADAAFGGCIYSKANVTLYAAAVSGCLAAGQTAAAGGGVLTKGDLTITGSVLTGNIADAAQGNGAKAVSAIGGAFVSEGTKTGLLMKSSVVSDNVAHAASGVGESGGGFAYSVKAKYSTFSGNRAYASNTSVNANYGAAGAVAASTYLYLKSSTVDGNDADKGGAVLVGKNATARFVQSTISGNHAGFGAGAILSYSDVYIANSTIAFNTGGTYGGGGVVLEANSTIYSSILADNSPTDLDAQGSNSGAKNIVKLVGAGTTRPPNGLTLDPHLLPLAYNGGQARTHALMPDSPAIDAGSNPLGLATDQRGERYPREVGLPDIGAVEFDADHVFYGGFDLM